MRRTVLFVLLLGAATFGFAEGNKFGLGVDGTINNTGSSVTGHADYTTSYVSLRGFLDVPLSATTEIMPFANFFMSSSQNSDGYLSDNYYSSAYHPLDFAQSGFGAGLAFYLTVAQAGPFAVKTGLVGALLTAGAPKNFVGDWSYISFSASAPLVLDISVGETFALRVSQPVVSASVDGNKQGTTTLGDSTFKVNGFNPAVGCILQF